MKPLVIYHANCADGFGAAFAAWLKLGDDAEYVPAQYGEDSYIKMLGAATNGVVNREVYVLDFSFPKLDMEALFSTAKRVVWLDHHKTAFEMWCKGFGGYTKGMAYIDNDDDTYGKGHVIRLDDNKSGAYLAWEYFHPGTEVPMLIRHIDDYDRWQFKLDGTKAFNKALWSYTPWSFEKWNMFLTPGGTETSDLFVEGEAILRAHDQNVKSVVKGAGRKCLIAGATPAPEGWASEHEHWETWPNEYLPGLAANCPPHLTSDVGHELANQSGTFGLCWYINKDMKCLCSLRSNGDYDVSAIAKAFGGGGHKNAAGFGTDMQTLLGWLK